MLRSPRTRSPPYLQEGGGHGGERAGDGEPGDRLAQCVDMRAYAGRYGAVQEVADVALPGGERAVLPDPSGLGCVHVPGEEGEHLP